MAYTNGLTPNRKNDHTDERELAKYLDKYFYKRVFPESERTDDKKHQLTGIDTILKSGGNKINIDEKGMTTIIGQKAKNKRPAPTFAFECSFESKGERHEGWLLSNDKETDAYVLCWYNDSKVERHPKMDDIKSLDVMLVFKDELLDRLSEKGLTPAQIRQDEQTIMNRVHKHPETLQGKETIGQFKKGFCEGFVNQRPDGSEIQSVYYYYSFKNLAEAPFNVIIRKDELENLPSTLKWTVTPDEIREHDFSANPGKSSRLTSEITPTHIPSDFKRGDIAL